MDSSSKLPPAEDSAQGGEKKKKDKQATNCTPFCEENCEFQGQHNDLIMSLINLNESDRASLDAWKEHVISLNNDIDEPLKDPNPNFRLPLLHWVATLGKAKAVQWLLTEDRVSLRKGNTQGMSNETVVFSMVRCLHEGVKSKDPNKISNIFVNILELLLKRDPYLLLVQEGSNSNTVLHLCAQGDESSTAPFLMYLKRTLVKLKEILNKNSESLPLDWLKTILQQKNEQGDTFIDVAARCKTQKEARELVDLILKQEFVLSVQKAEEILNQRKQNERENVDDDQNGDNDEDHISMGDGENEAANEKEQQSEVNNTFEPTSSAVFVPDLAPPAKIPKITDKSSTFSEDPLRGGVTLQSVCSHLQQWNDDSESKVTILQDPTEAPASASTNRAVKRGSWDQSTTSDVATETESIGNTELAANVKASVEKLIQKTEQDLLKERNELEKAESEHRKMESEIKELQDEKEKKEKEIERGKETVKDLEQQLDNCKQFLEKLRYN